LNYSSSKLYEWPVYNILIIKKTGYYLGNGHISFWAMPPVSQPLIAKPVASKSFTALYCKENGGSHLPPGDDKDSPGRDF